MYELFNFVCFLFREKAQKNRLARVLCLIGVGVKMYKRNFILHNLSETNPDNCNIICARARERETFFLSCCNLRHKISSSIKKRVFFKALSAICCEQYKTIGNENAIRK